MGLHTGLAPLESILNKTVLRSLEGNTVVPSKFRSQHGELRRSDVRGWKDGHVRRGGIPVSELRKHRAGTAYVGPMSGDARLNTHVQVASSAPPWPRPPPRYRYCTRYCPVCFPYPIINIATLLSFGRDLVGPARALRCYS